MNPNTAPLIRAYRAPKGAGRAELAIHYRALTAKGGIWHKPKAGKARGK